MFWDSAFTLPEGDRKVSLRLIGERPKAPVNRYFEGGAPAGRDAFETPPLCFFFTATRDRSNQFNRLDPSAGEPVVAVHVVGYRAPDPQLRLQRHHAHGGPAGAGRLGGGGGGGRVGVQDLHHARR